MIFVWVDVGGLQSLWADSADDLRYWQQAGWKISFTYTSYNTPANKNSALMMWELRRFLRYDIDFSININKNQKCPDPAEHAPVVKIRFVDWPLAFVLSVLRVWWFEFTHASTAITASSIVCAPSMHAAVLTDMGDMTALLPEGASKNVAKNEWGTLRENCQAPNYVIDVGSGTYEQRLLWELRNETV